METVIAKINSLQKDICSLEADVEASVDAVDQFSGSFVDLETEVRKCRELVSKLELRIGDLERLLGGRVQANVRKEFQDVVIESRRNLAKLTSRLRQAVVGSVSRIEEAQRSLLLSQPGGGKAAGRASDVHSKRINNEAAKMVSDLSLLLTRMDGEVRHSEEILGVLVSSSNTLHETEMRYKLFSDILSSSKKLLSQYGRRRVAENAIIFVLFLFYLWSAWYIGRQRSFL